jgi:hypothetical protein
MKLVVLWPYVKLLNLLCLPAVGTVLYFVFRTGKVFGLL